MQRSPKFYKLLQRFLNSSEFIQTYLNSSEFIQTDPNGFKFIWIYPNFSELFQTYLNFFKLIRTNLNFSKLIRTSPNSFELIQTYLNLSFSKGGMLSEKVDGLKKIFQKALFNYLMLYRALVICKFSIIFYLQLYSIYSY